MRTTNSLTLLTINILSQSVDKRDPTHRTVIIYLYHYNTKHLKPHERVDNRISEELTKRSSITIMRAASFYAIYGWTIKTFLRIYYLFIFTKEFKHGYL